MYKHSMHGDRRVCTTRSTVRHGTATSCHHLRPSSCTLYTPCTPLPTPHIHAPMTHRMPLSSSTMASNMSFWESSIADILALNAFWEIRGEDSRDEDTIM